MEQLAKREEDLKALAAVETDGRGADGEAGGARLRARAPRESFTRQNDQQRKAQAAMDELDERRPAAAGRGHCVSARRWTRPASRIHVLADAIDLARTTSGAPPPKVSCGPRAGSVLAHASDEGQAYRLRRASAIGTTSSPTASSRRR